MKLATLFSDGAVLQREMPVPVWGWTTPSAFIRASINDSEAFTRASQTGRFMLRLPPMPAGGPYDLTVSRIDEGSDEGSDETVIVRNVYIGEVWLASGQSNMEYNLGANWAWATGATLNKEQKDEFIANIKDPATLRAITVPRTAGGVSEETFKGSWLEMNAENADLTSATALWFGHYLRETLGVPVGLVVSAWGGTRIESWTSLKGLRSNPDTENAVSWRDYSFALESARILWREGKTPEGMPRPKDGYDLGYAAPDFNDTDWKEIKIPGSWIGQQIAGNGALWIRRTITLPATWEGKEATIEIDGVDKQDTTYFNGEEVGYTGKVGEGFDLESYGIERSYTIPARLVKSGNNTIAVRATSCIFDGSFALNANGGCRLICKELDETIDIGGTWKALSEYDLGPYARLYDSMIAPLVPYAIRGAIWYQGESNADYKSDAEIYMGEMQTLIKSWRNEWGQGDFPFIQVQLANFHAASPYNGDQIWPILRNAQRKAAEATPNAYMATAVDIGDARDIHPQNKKEVGLRLSYVALNKVYDKDNVVPFGPLIKKAESIDGKIVLTFENSDGMKFNGDKAQGFYVGDKDGNYTEAATAEINGATVVLTSTVTSPAAVRYSWSDNPDGNLYNAANLPASPFQEVISNR